MCCFRPSLPRWKSCGVSPVSCFMSSDHRVSNTWVVDDLEIAAVTGGLGTAGAL